MRALYSATVFINAFLLFLVQPLIAKRLLPVFGGSPLVWNTCLLFFQFVLLLGYLYAHLSFKWFGHKKQPWVHLAVIVVPALTLPIGLPLALRTLYNEALVKDPSSLAAQPAFMLLLMLFGSVGLPFFALSAGAPVLQKWFSHTDDPNAHNPYFLYQASNLGSMLALLSYPLWFERVFGLKQQSVWWSAGYGVLILVLGVSAFALRRSYSDQAAAMEDHPEPSPAPVWREPLLWIFLSAGPSALLLASTNYLTTNVAPIPLLWVIPLALYLITFIIAFSSRPLPDRIFIYLAIGLIFPVVVASNIEGSLPIGMMVIAHLTGFFLLALACHTQIGKSRPAAAHLTEFYLWISVGGVIGGFFSAIVAPLVFTSLAEYPIAITACFLAIGIAYKPRQVVIQRPPNPLFEEAEKAQAEGRSERAAELLRVARESERDEGKPNPMVPVLDVAMPIVAGFMVWWMAGHFVSDKNEHSWVYIVGAAMLFTSLRPIRFAFTLAAIFIGLHFGLPADPRLLSERSFFGVHYVIADSVGGLPRHRLLNGNTTHGAQFWDPALRRTPTTYYSAGSGIGRAIKSLQKRQELNDFAVVGLGAGSLAVYGKAGETIDYYEIDPSVERLARNTKYFTYLADTPAKVNVLIGDARLRLQQAPQGKYDMLALDAFSSDAIPIHLLTTEAFQLYMKTLKPDGLLVVHVSNRYLLLAPVVAAICKDLNLDCLSGEDLFDMERDPRSAKGEYSSWWLIVGSKRAIDPFRSDDFWTTEPIHPGIRAWTDDYSNVLSTMKIFKP